MKMKIMLNILTQQRIKIAPKPGVKFRILNESKGYAVQSTRVQIDKEKYSVQEFSNYILKYVPSEQKLDSQIIEIPDKCPICGSQAKKELLSEQNNQVNFEKYIRCTGGFSCSSQAKERLKHFVSKEAFDIDGLGEKQINDFFDMGLIKSPTDIFSLEKRYKNNPPKIWIYTSGSKSKINTIKDSAIKLFKAILNT